MHWSTAWGLFSRSSIQKRETSKNENFQAHPVYGVDVINFRRIKLHFITVKKSESAVKVKVSSVIWTEKISSTPGILEASKTRPFGHDSSLNAPKCKCDKCDRWGSFSCPEINWRIFFSNSKILNVAPSPVNWSMYRAVFSKMQILKADRAKDWTGSLTYQVAFGRLTERKTTKNKRQTINGRIRSIRISSGQSWKIK
jgi:hypothetical protein